MQGIFKLAAALTTGTETNPPFEKTTSGLICFKSLRACEYPFTTRNGSEKFFGSKYLLNFPVEIP